MRPKQVIHWPNFETSRIRKIRQSEHCGVVVSACSFIYLTLKLLDALQRGLL
jgi:hypothetical protein